VNSPYLDFAQIYNRLAGTKEGFNYSSAMVNLQQTRNELSLDLLLANPSRYVPGTRMAAPPLTDAEDRHDIVGCLAESKK
jgi:cytochrome c